MILSIRKVGQNRSLYTSMKWFQTQKAPGPVKVGMEWPMMWGVRMSSKCGPQVSSRYMNSLNAIFTFFHLDHLLDLHRMSLSCGLNPALISNAPYSESSSIPLCPSRAPWYWNNMAKSVRLAAINNGFNECSSILGSYHRSNTWWNLPLHNSWKIDFKGKKHLIFSTRHAVHWLW